MYVGTYCSDLHKMVYLENRTYLPAESSLRQQKKGFPSKENEFQPPPLKRSFELMKKYHEAFDEASKT